MYDSLHLNFAFSVPRPLMEKLAASSVRQQCQQRIAKVHDQFLAFRALEAGLFSLGLPNVYVDLNAPGVQDHQVQVRLPRRAERWACRQLPGMQITLCCTPRAAVFSDHGLDNHS